MFSRIKRLFSSIFLSAFLSSSANAQEYKLANGATIRPEARVAVYGVNVLGNGFVCGAVAAFKRRNIIEDAIKCMFAANIQYLGMELGMKNIPALPGFALRILETGTSMIDNTIAGRGLLDRLHYEFNTFLFEVDTKDSDLRLYWRVMPIVGTAVNIAQGNTFSIEDTLSYQTATFYRLPTDSRIGGHTIGNVMMYQRTRNAGVSENVARRRAHEFAHVTQYTRLRPAQNAVPDSLGFLEERLHLRIGEDITTMIVKSPKYICEAIGGKDCDIQPYNLTEVEAYAMQTAN